MHFEHGYLSGKEMAPLRKYRDPLPCFLGITGMVITKSEGCHEISSPKIKMDTAAMKLATPKSR